MRLYLIVLVFFCSYGFAQVCTEDFEPNDIPANATEVEAAPCIVGDLSGDDQDIYRWVVTEEQASLQWQFAIEGIPNQLTKFDLLRLSFAENGTDVTAKEDVFSLGTSTGQLVQIDKLLLSPGVYYFGIAKSGGEGSYGVDMIPGRELRWDYKPSNEIEGAGAVFGTFEEGASLNWMLTTEDAKQLWTIEARAALGEKVTLNLLDSSGQNITQVSSDETGFMRLSSLGLAEGSYTLELSGGVAIAPFNLTTVPAGTITEGTELEPNDSRQPNALSVETGILGELTDGDEDHFQFVITPEQSEKPWTISLKTSAEVELCLATEAIRDLRCQRNVGGIVFNDLMLEANTYALSLDGISEAPYEIEFSQGSVAKAGVEVEPNDVFAAAFELGTADTVRGTLEGSDDTDFYQFATVGEPLLYRVQVLARDEGLYRIRIYNAAQATEQNITLKAGETRARLDNVVLLPGQHFLSIEGSDVDYGIKFLPLGPAVLEAESEEVESETASSSTAASSTTTASSNTSSDPDAAIPGPRPEGRSELEPNNDQTRAELLQAGKPRIGLLVDDSDVDYYRFFLANDGRVRLTLKSAATEDVRLGFDLTDYGRAEMIDGDEAAVLEADLLAGDYFLDLWARAALEGYYQIKLELLNPLDLPIDAEPNNIQAEASIFPLDGVIIGKVGENSTHDWYNLPSFESDTRLNFVTESDSNITIYLYDRRTGENNISLSRVEGGQEAILPAGAEQDLRVQGKGDYRITVSTESQSFESLGNSSDIELSLSSDTSEIAAYWFEGQALDLSLSLQNNSSSSQTFDLSAASSDYKVRADVESSLTLAAGESKVVPVSLDILRDLRDDQPLLISAAAKTEFGVSKATDFSLAPMCQAPPVESQLRFPVPEALLGGFDLAAPHFGAELPEDPLSRGVFDGRTSPSTGAWIEKGESITIKVAGDGQIPIAGLLLHPWGRSRIPDQLNGFEIFSSQDGVSFQKVYAGELSAVREEQAVVFDEPIVTSHIQLKALNNFEQSKDIGIGQIKVVAVPGSNTFGSINIAEPIFGGNVVWTKTTFGKGGYGGGNNPILTEAIEKPSSSMVEGQESTEWVVGFHNARAAKIDQLEWVDGEHSNPELRFETVEIFTSLSSPVGPWEKLADWELEHSATDKLTLDTPVWARYVRFSVSELTPRKTYSFPETIRIIETETSNEYKSIIAEWGHYNRSAAYELSQQVKEQPFTIEADNNESRETAQVLSSGDVVEGTVLVQEDLDWFKFTIPEGENTLELSLEGDPTISYTYNLTDSNGDAVFYETSGSLERTVLKVFAEPGDYYLKIEEPSRSVVFSWDTSGSVSAYQATTYQTLAGFARDIEPGREDVQLLAFADPDPRWLLRRWTGNTTEALTAITNYDRRDGSSNSENALLTATNALAKREGTKAVLLITDAESNGYNLTPELWESLSEVRPRVFTFEVSSSGSDYSQDLMQNWTEVNNGVYQYASNIGALDAGFARASCLLRRPKRYRIEVKTSFAAPPGPGSLKVSREGGTTSNPATEIIFDASGSMGKKLDNGQSRIDAAKTVLSDLVNSALPEGTPFALRAFGHIQPSSCETKLEIPVGPLNRAEVSSFISSIQPKLLSQTPLADSLAAVADDLQGATGSKTVLLITDGEESCDGDPEAAIRSLREQNIDVSLNIIGFAIDDEASKEQFSDWAELGGGQYFDTNSAEELQDSINKALRPSFDILDMDNNVIARGVVGGESVEVPAGVYNLRIGDQLIFEEVRVPGESGVELSLGE